MGKQQGHEIYMTVDEVLAAAHRKHGHDGIYENTPVDDLIRKEDSGECGLDEIDREREMAIRMEAFRELLGFLFSQGPCPGHVCRRVFCLAKAFAPELILNMGVRDLGKLFGESHGTWQWRVKQVVQGFVKKQTGQDLHLGYQKSAESSAKYSQAQKGNKNRSNGERKKRLDAVKS